jgi:hypothetical protein
MKATGFLAAALAIAPCLGAHAQDPTDAANGFPARPIRVIVPFSSRTT